MRQVVLLSKTTCHSDKVCILLSGAGRKVLAVEASAISLSLLRSIWSAVAKTVSLTRIISAGCCLKADLDPFVADGRTVVGLDHFPNPVLKKFCLEHPMPFFDLRNVTCVTQLAWLLYVCMDIARIFEVSTMLAVGTICGRQCPRKMKVISWLLPTQHNAKGEQHHTGRSSLVRQANIAALLFPRPKRPLYTARGLFSPLVALQTSWKWLKISRRYNQRALQYALRSGLLYAVRFNIDEPGQVKRLSGRVCLGGLRNASK